MAQLPQLFMRFTDFAALPTLSARTPPLPDGIALCTHTPGEEGEWESLIEASFGHHYDFDAIMRSYLDYHPAHIFYLTRDGRKIATASAFRRQSFPEAGWLHMVGVSPDAQGLGLARQVVLPALYSFYARGYRSVMLSTDDHRLPAIKTYLRLGFTPVYSHESHDARWHDVLSRLGMEIGR